MMGHFLFHVFGRPSQKHSGVSRAEAPNPDPLKIFCWNSLRAERSLTRGPFDLQDTPLAVFSELARPTRLLASDN